MALDHLGQRYRGADLDRRFDFVFLVRGELRFLQQNLRLARRGRWLHDLDLDFLHDNFGRSRN